MKKLITLIAVIIAGTMTFYAADYPGGLPGLFSINAHGGQVRFAQGNLQYLASTDTWRFASNQHDTIGVDNRYISAQNNNWIDLFGWATSGYDNTANDPCAINYLPYSTSAVKTACVQTNCYGYGPSIDQPYRGLVASSDNYDWGVYNTISNGEAGVAWRTLSGSEWYYVLFGRPNAANLRSQATISNIHGYILLPDEWQMPAGLTFVPTANNWTDNTYTASQWITMEQAGAVFLPAAGERTSNGCRYINEHGLYWTASAANSIQAQVIHFNDTTMFQNSRYRRSYGHAVRLVHDENEQIDPLAKFAGFDARNAPLGDWIYNNGGFQNATNLTIEETDTILHKYTIILTAGGQESSFTLGGVRFSYTNSAAKNAFKTSNWAIWPDGKDRKIIIPTNPGDEILINVADTVDYLGLLAQGVSTSTIDLNAGDNMLQATSDSIVITTSNTAGTEVKVKIGAILCLAHRQTEGFDALTNVAPQTRKIIRNGQILIQKGDKTYTLTGQEVK